MSRIVLFLSFLGVSVLSLAQQQFELVSGKVISKENLGLTEAKISNVTRSESWDNVDGLACFRIEAYRGDTICARSAGYEQKCLALDAQNSFIELQLDTLQDVYENPFATLVNSAGKTNRSIKEIPASVVVIDKEEILSFGFQSVEEILLNVPGLYGIEQHDWTGQGTNYGVRGFYSAGPNNEMAVMVNGVLALEDYWGYNPLSRVDVPVESIERIEVVRGPMSVVYGSGAFLGSINIITNQVGDGSNNIPAQLTLVGGLAGDYRLSAVVGNKTDLGAHKLSLGVRQDNGVDHPFESIDESFAGSGLTGSLKSRRFFMNYSGQYDNITANIAFGYAEKDHFNVISWLPLDTAGSQETRLLGGNAQVRYSDYLDLGARIPDSLMLFDLKVGVFFHRNFQDYLTSQSAGAHAGLGSFESAAFEIEANTIWRLSETKAAINSDFTLGAYYRAAHNLFTAIEFGGPEGNDVFRLKPGTVKGNLGLILSNYTKIADNILVSAGLRYERIPSYTADLSFDQMSIFEPRVKEATSILIPRASVIFEITPNDILKTIFSQGTKQPSFGMLTDNGGATLNPSSLTSYELNYLKSWSFKGNSARINQLGLSVFYNDIDGLIDRISNLSAAGEDDQSFYSVTQLGEYETLGVEVSNKFNLGKVCELQLNYTAQFTNNKSTYQEGGEIVQVPYVPFSPRHLFYISARGELTDGLNYGVKWRYVGSMYSEFIYQDFNSDGTVVGFQQYAEADSYLVGDVHLSYDRLAEGRLVLSADVKNMLDATIVYPYSQNTYMFPNGALGRGRLLLLSVTWNLSND